MKQTVKICMLLVSLTLGIASCTDSDNSETPAPAPEAAEYTIMYYATGGGNVDQCILPMVEDFYKASAEAYKKVNVVVQYKFSTADDLKAQYDNADHTPFADRFTDDYRSYFASQTIRWAVNPAATMDVQMHDVANRYGKLNADCTCPDSLTNFINWAAAAYPAKKYILIMNDHGHGYRPDEDLPDDAPAAAARRGMIFDDGHLLADGSKKHFTVKNFTRAIRSAGVRFETVYMLACLMNNLEYLFEMKDLCDYIIAATYTMPAAGGALNVMVQQFAQPAVDVEQALTAYCKADVESWDEAWGVTPDTPVYTDLTVSRTSAFGALATQLRQFTDRLCDTYQNGTDAQRQIIDDCTAEAVKVQMTNPYYDAAKYITNIMEKLPKIYSQAFFQQMKDAFNSTLVSQHRSKYLELHHYQVDYSILLGVLGSYSVLTWQQDDQTKQWTLLSRKRYCADGTTYVSTYTPQAGVNNYAETLGQPSDPWNSTLAATFEQLTFDRLVGWSRWLRLNRKEPSLFCPSDLNFVLPDGDVSHDPII